MVLAAAAAPAANASADSARGSARRAPRNGQPARRPGSRPRGRDAERGEAGAGRRGVQAAKRDPAPLARRALDRPARDVECRDPAPLRPAARDGCGGALVSERQRPLGRRFDRHVARRVRDGGRGRPGVRRRPQDIHRRARDHVSGAVEERPAAQGDRLGRAVGGGARYVAQAALASPGREARAATRRARSRIVPSSVPGAAARTSRPTPQAASSRTTSRQVYGHNADANHDGTGQIIGFVEFSSYNRQDSLDFKQCYNPTITGTLTNDRQGERRHDRARRPGRGQPRHPGRDGRGPDAELAHLHRAEQPGAPADDAREDARRERRRRVGQLGPVRAGRPGEADRGRERRARAARSCRRLVLCRVGR